MLRRVVLVAAQRTPFAPASTLHRDALAVDLAVAALTGLFARSGVAPSAPGLVVLGSVIMEPSASNLAREAALVAGVPPAVPAFTVTNACISSLSAAACVFDAIRLPRGPSAGVAGGAETASDAPIRLSRGLRRAALAWPKAKGARAAARVLGGLRWADLALDLPAVAEYSTGETMGASADRLALAFGVGRAEADAYALGSHQKAAAAHAAGFYAQDVLPLPPAAGAAGGARAGGAATAAAAAAAAAGGSRPTPAAVGAPPARTPASAGAAPAAPPPPPSWDPSIKPDSTAARLASLKPAFSRGGGGGGGVCTAGNSSGLTDGAAAVLLMDAAAAEAAGLPARAELLDYVFTGLAPAGDLLLAPALAVARLLARPGAPPPAAVTVWELHEPFACVALAVLKALATPGWAGAGAPAVVPGGVPPERLNAWGGSLATGHPFAATGARLLATAAARLVAGGGHGYAVVTACAAGGQGAAFLLKGVPAEAVAVIAPAAGGKAAAAGVAFARAGATAAMA